MEMNSYEDFKKTKRAKADKDVALHTILLKDEIESQVEESEVIYILLSEGFTTPEDITQYILDNQIQLFKDFFDKSMHGKLKTAVRKAIDKIQEANATRTRNSNEELIRGEAVMRCDRIFQEAMGMRRMDWALAAVKAKANALGIKLTSKPSWSEDEEEDGVSHEEAEMDRIALEQMKAMGDVETE